MTIVILKISLFSVRSIIWQLTAYTQSFQFQWYPRVKGVEIAALA